MPNPVLNAFNEARGIREAEQQRQTAQGMANTAGKIENAFMQGNPELGGQLAQRSGDAGLMQGAQQRIGQQQDAESAAAAERLGRGIAILGDIASLPYEQRRQVMQTPQFAQTAGELGFQPEQIAGFDPTDQNIQGILAQFGQLRQTLGTGGEQVPTNVRALRLRALDAGLEPGSPQYQDFMRTGGRPERGPLVNVNTGQPQPDPFATALRADDADRALAVRTTARSAQGTIYNLDILQDTLLDPTVYTGAGAQLTLPLRRAAEQFGMDAGNISASEVANRVSSEMALALKDRLPGPMSDGDRQFLMSIPPNLENTREGNAAIIFMTRRRAQYEQRLAASMDAALGQNPTGAAYQAWEQQQRDIARTQPLYTEDDRRAVQLLLNGAEFRRSGNDIYVIDGDEAIRLGE
jgi:hypothetical protein